MLDFKCRRGLQERGLSMTEYLLEDYDLTDEESRTFVTFSATVLL